MKVNLARWPTGLAVAILVCLMSVNSACVPQPTPTPTPNPAVTPGSIPSDLEIYYSWGACHMDWGFYQLIINSEGEASFEKSQNIAEPFSEQSQLSLTEDELVSLYQEIKNNNFFDLDEQYRNPEIMDGECHLLRITAEGKELAVSVSNRRIESFDRITEAIIEILASKVPDWEALGE